MAHASGAREALILALGLLGLAGLFVVLRWAERQARPADLTDLDARHFARKDTRRLAVAAILALIAVGLIAGTRINYRADRATGRLFGIIWLTVGLLVLILLVLAFADWLANAQFARRQRRALIEEHRALLADLARRYGSSREREATNGRDGVIDPGQTID
jgi:uncharacterized membrane protein